MSFATSLIHWIDGFVHLFCRTKNNITICQLRHFFSRDLMQEKSIVIWFLSSKCSFCIYCKCALFQNTIQWSRRRQCYWTYFRRMEMLNEAFVEHFLSKLSILDAFSLFYFFLSIFFRQWHKVFANVLCYLCMVSITNWWCHIIFVYKKIMFFFCFCCTMKFKTNRISLFTRY